MPARLFYQPAPANVAANQGALRAPADLSPGATGPRPSISGAPCGRANSTVAAGAGELAKLLAESELVVAKRPVRTRDAAVSRAKLDRASLGLFARFRALRQRAGLRAQEIHASNEPRERRFFLFATATRGEPPEACLARTSARCHFSLYD